MLSPDYLAASCHLAYGRTSHDVQGSTFAGNGYALVLPGDDREYLYTALITRRRRQLRVRGDRGAAAWRPASPSRRPRSRGHGCSPPSRPASTPGEHSQSAPAPGSWPQCSARTSEELSATETLERAFSDADNLAVLSRMWTDLSGGEYGRRYTEVLRDLLGEDQAQAVAADPRYTWLCRTLRAGEIAGMDGRQVLAEAVRRRQPG